jgi:hypothetical protein
MDMLADKSSLGVGSFAISVACDYEYKNDKIVPNRSTTSSSSAFHPSASVVVHHLGNGATGWFSTS